MRRNKIQKLKDFITFPLRALVLIEKDKWGLSALASERFDYVAREVRGYCLDVGCGRYNRFIKDYLNSDGRGIDIFKYEGLTDDNIIKDISHFPFNDSFFKSITFIANINHIPEDLRDIELGEAYRCLENGGNVVITMGNPMAEILVHKVVWIYDKVLGTNYDMDNERGMEESEKYYLKDSEIIERLSLVGFKDITKKFFVTQWGLNHLLIGWKK